MRTAFSTKSITRIALFVALALAFRAVPIPPILDGFFRFAALPIILSGFLLGPKHGFWVGAVSDVLECVLFPRGPYIPVFTLTQALTGFLPAFIAKNHKNSFIWLLGSIATGQIVTKIFLVPFFRQLILSGWNNFEAGWRTLAEMAAFTQLFHIPLYAWLCCLIIKALEPANLDWSDETKPDNSENTDK